ncbi:HEAT repeat,HECT-domain isoform 1 [Dorcoceras hygrometricum]|uniref:HEAT repeat,HECT-domain isoform 1 n=1 Tax=Dorcoceras hygrometricum TaxID=472368 RepID=A0A2Z7CYQ7_9LAMI|nr:HEAT repeat,HECT-domain isoform 1 [Dorcoceras hygrometricum]
MRIRPPELETSICDAKYRVSLPPPPPPLDRTCSDQLFEEFPSVLISLGLLVQADEGTLLPVMDLIRRFYRRLPTRASFPVILVGARRLSPARREIWAPPDLDLQASPRMEEFRIFVLEGKGRTAG